MEIKIIAVTGVQQKDSIKVITRVFLNYKRKGTELHELESQTNGIGGKLRGWAKDRGLLPVEEKRSS